jgi:hypothetical protein
MSDPDYNATMTFEAYAEAFAACAAIVMLVWLFPIPMIDNPWPLVSLTIAIMGLWAYWAAKKEAKLAYERSEGQDV